MIVRLVDASHALPAVPSRQSGVVLYAEAETVAEAQPASKPLPESVSVVGTPADDEAGSTLTRSGSSYRAKSLPSAAAAQGPSSPLSEMDSWAVPALDADGAAQSSASSPSTATATTTSVCSSPDVRLRPPPSAKKVVLVKRQRSPPRSCSPGASTLTVVEPATGPQRGATRMPPERAAAS